VWQIKTRTSLFFYIRQSLDRSPVDAACGLQKIKKEVYVKRMKKIFILCFLFLTACETATTKSAAHNPDKTFEPIEMIYTYKNLKLNDLDQMMDLMFAKTNEFKKTEQIQKLKEGALIAYSRPDEDRTLDKVISLIKNPLEDNNEWENTIEALIQQSVVRLNDEKGDPVIQVTSGVVLDNIISDLKPLFLKQYKSGGFETEMMEKIGDSHVMYSKSAKSERKLNLMRVNSSPSEIANRLLQQKEEFLKAEKK
jgi:hypothetical protein